MNQSELDIKYVRVLYKSSVASSGQFVMGLNENGMK